MKPQLFLIYPLLSALIIGCSSERKNPAPPAEEGFRCGEPVAISTGLLRGSVDEAGTSCSWKGVPYAAPPVGDLRWKAPRPVPEWEGVRDAAEWGDVCMQSWFLRVSHFSPAAMSEDCLNLNIWRPRRAGKFPVMVWIHGGANLGGMGSSPGYWGDRLAAGGGVVVVTINYRLGAFGFLPHDALAREHPGGSTGNYGLLDQIAALAWVRDNIAGFGGDPRNVTIFGESAGGWGVCALLASPRAKGLFHRAIIESGGCESVRPREEGSAAGKWAAERLGCDENDIRCMRKQSAKKIQKKLHLPPLEALRTGKFRYVFHADGCVLTDAPVDCLREGKFNNVPLIAGTNRDEAKPGSVMPDRRFMGKKKLEQIVRRDFGETADTLLALYPADHFSRPSEAWTTMVADRMLRCPTYRGALAVARHQPRTFFYRFDFDEIAFGDSVGAMHMLEVPFVFGNFDRMPLKYFFKNADQEALRGLSRLMQGYWVNFARTGDPNGAGLPEWPALDPGDPKLLVLDSTVRIDEPDPAGRCAFWWKYHRENPGIFQGGFGE